ncbi:hypothetical protein EMO92_06840 [Bifidobacterium reuteri]|uniref:Uncharacterized protein n=1 Tax=Bifidobacterium reuteri TaxID=983706 RepID=A0A5J5E7A4_9BIFI|nr:MULTISPECIES: hypothetical protein [Bifidobacterium]KAA8825130.1 hypothetical protein EMO92_06840 [Bifidobacterium reuteri]TPF91451.1 hypothetical protein BW10_00400 [Bifidobacterium sp. UTBIF-56]
MNDDLDEYIRLARQGKTPVTEADRKAERNHRNYLRILERDPEYYTRRRRMERRNRNSGKHQSEEETE